MLPPRLTHSAAVPSIPSSSAISLLSVPATYGESFGLYLLEAMASGVPVVQPRHAAFPEILEKTGGGILCEPDDPSSLAEGLEELLSDQPRATELAAQDNFFMPQQPYFSATA